MLKKLIQQTHKLLSTTLRYGGITAIVIASVLGSSIGSSLPFNNIKAEAAPVYTCPAGSVLVGTSCQVTTCVDGSAPVGGNCSIAQMGLFECNGTGTQIMYKIANNNYPNGLCTNRPDLFVQGGCVNDKFDMREGFWTASPGTRMGAGMWQGGSAPIDETSRRLYANGRIRNVVDNNGGVDYDYVMSNFRDNNMQNNMCALAKVTATVGDPDSADVYPSEFERLGNERACPAGFGVFIIPSAQKHYIISAGPIGVFSLQYKVPVVCANYSVNTTALKSIAASTGYRPQTCLSIGMTELYSVDMSSGDAESSALCGPSSPQPASVVGITTTTPATFTTNAPDGSLDGITNRGVASGWATDADVPNTPLDVHFYLDGVAGIGTYIGKTTSSFVRPDLAAPYNTGNNGYNFAIPEQYCDGQAHTLSAYAIDAPSSVSNTLLGGSPKSFNLTPAQCSNVVNTGGNGTTSNIDTSRNCTTGDVNLINNTTFNSANDKLRCVFPLSGSTRPGFTLPADGLKATVTGATGTGDACFVDNNYQQVLYRKVNPDQTVGKSLLIPYSAYGTNKDNFDNYGGLTAGTGNGAGNLPLKTGWINDTLADMNGDGKPDLVWRNYDTTGADAGKTVVWFMDKDKILSTTTLATKVIDPNWHIVGAGDFDGDGKVDLAWANYATKTIAIWYMSGGNTTDLVSSGNVKLNASDTNTAIIPDGWRIQAVGDMDGNGKAELIWRKITGDGALAYWSTSSTQLTPTTRNVYIDTINTQTLLPTNSLADQSFQIYAAGDLNSDGKTDLVWADLARAGNAATRVYVWNMNNTTRLSDKIMETFGGNLAPWKISGLGDMDSDGKLDIVYKYYGNGQSYLTCPNIPVSDAPAGVQNVSIIKGTEAPVTKGSTLVTAIPSLVINATNLLNGSCISVVAGSSTVCDYPLANSGSINTYSLPVGGITVTVPGSIASPACVIANNGSSSAKLVCTGVPTIGSTVGTKAVPTSLGGTATAALVITELPTVLITAIDLTNLNMTCGTGSTILVSSTTTCTGTAPTGKGLDPANPIKISIGNATTMSDACTQSGMVITCTNVPTGSQPGQQIVYATLGNSPKVDTTNKATVTSSGTISTIGLKVMLTGAYNSSTSMLKTTLRTKNLVPMMQPYNDAVFNYAGTETMTVMPTDAVDWVLVELRQGTTTVTKKAGILKMDGTVIDTTSNAGIVFNNLPTGSYQVIVRHRNHLAIATNTPITLTAGQGTTLDMTTNANVKGANQAMLKVGVYGMRLANTNGNNAINASDRTISRQGVDGNNVYRQIDVNMDGIVNAQDRTLSRLANEAVESI